MAGSSRTRVHRHRVPVVVVVVAIALGAAACGSSNSKRAKPTTASSASTSTTVKSGATSFGAATVTAIAVDGNGFVAVGRAGPGDGTRGAAWSAGPDGATWKRAGAKSAIEAPEFFPNALTVAAGRAVAVGFYPPENPKPGSALDAAIIVRENSDVWRSDYTDVPAGSTELYGVAGNDTTIVAVGAYAKGEIGNPNGTMPLVQVSTDDAENFSNIKARVPLPTGATGAEMRAVTIAPPGTPYPGFVAAGYAWINSGKQRKTIGVVWQSKDALTWKVVSDSVMSEDVGDVYVTTVAADASTIIAGGYNVIDATSGLTKGTAWRSTGKRDTPWQVSVDEVAAKQSSETTALTALTKGGFALSSQFFATAAIERDGPDSTVKLFSTTDGTDYSVNGDADARKITGVAAGAANLVYVGLAKNGESDAWVHPR